ncbi:MAG: heat-inducible transcriptional repressor HrcA [Syntrophotalea acetylenica]|uniref:Heat-inducible transcription repressor HrcA n=1 Tax=Syntrophotalea acetylenica TaxID=29542 RepID=A0A1L3GG02_SYNAC|nr:heat-inducible transcriptional repressor HrcA [Syntrophotalea acetylenica]APG24765.1 heat-inducible transcription repressor HrcA [Syntrophotalea acetylenica]APG42820.1 heat-inducible transcriptional repressor HrcA [Syntrophotalea acetylenica]MDD4456182.1 heat-inducible transcriptional repressor HrcA [Syntrophotalea acetylenica]MDY0261678.1 heat-inducible transcriptional repressor HrcA [Syntrophotalea acetylenica]
MNEELNERCRLILEAIIEDYILSGEPIGSRALTRRHAIPLSPATVRNVMADLEEMGYLTSPHTSAGRIPTEKGYRFYLDSLLRIKQLSPSKRQSIREHYRNRRLRMEELLREAGRILSTSSSYTGVVMVPQLATTICRRIDFVRLSARRILAVFVSQSGIVEHKIIESDLPLNESQLQEAANYLNQTYSGLSIQDIKQRIVVQMAEEMATYDTLLRRALHLSCLALEDDFGGQIYIEGASNILDQPEFNDLSRMRRLMRTFDQKNLLMELLHKSQLAEGVQIYIGSPDHYSDIEGCSLVAASFSSRWGAIGTLGIIGPTRMPYSTVIPLVDFTAGLIGSILDSEEE